MSPIHIFVCPKCSTETDIAFSYGDKIPTIIPDCPRCKIPMIRSWNDTPVHFKGKGFYATDNKKETR